MILELRDAVVYGKERNYSSSKVKDLEFRLVVCPKGGIAWAEIEERDFLMSWNH